MAEEQVINRKIRVGTVVSDINDQTLVVEVERASRHRIYRKVIRRTKRYHVHDEQNTATRGDFVSIEECRPVSKLKRWRLVEVLTERAVAEVAPESIGQEVVDEVQRSAARAVAEAETSSTDGGALVDNTGIDITDSVTPDEMPATEELAEVSDSDEAVAASETEEEQKAD
tara:strand:- start:160 stop:672 length:513 start_codon:yes stop_codon:yes gene_type:complete